jgi:addiction module HigA family antidote
MAMYNPPHPGEVIYDVCLQPLELTITEAAEGLGISRNALSEIINGHTGISPTMAIRLSLAFGGTPDSWLMQQMQYDLWHAQQHGKNLGSIRRFT